MLKTRVIPCLLLKDNGLVKTVKFKDPIYIGDPVNAVRIFNEKEVDEVVLLDITASIDKRKPQFDLVSEVAGECFMPLAYGGGINDLDDIKRLLNSGAEKVIINTHASEDPSFITKAAGIHGSQSIVASIDAKRNLGGRYEARTRSARRGTGVDPVTLAIQMEASGAGEILLNSIDMDGTMQGYDIELIKKVSEAVSIPVVACGGAGNLSDFESAVKLGGASAVAAGSLFVFYGRRGAVLINYPSIEEIENVLM